MTPLYNHTSAQSGYVVESYPYGSLRCKMTFWLDEEGHCKWSGLGQYSSAEEIRSFIERFPDADFSLLRPFLALKLSFQKRYAEDKFRITINGKSEAPSESELEDRRKELAILVRAQEALNQAARG